MIAGNNLLAQHDSCASRSSLPGRGARPPTSRAPGRVDDRPMSRPRHRPP